MQKVLAILIETDSLKCNHKYVSIHLIKGYLRTK
jgi:hypothetical protein